LAAGAADVVALRQDNGCMNSFRWFLAVASLVVLALGLPPAHAQDKNADSTSEGRKLAQAKS
jgi:hypothetical protein